MKNLITLQASMGADNSTMTFESFAILELKEDVILTYRLGDEEVFTKVFTVVGIELVESPAGKLYRYDLEVVA